MEHNGLAIDDHPLIPPPASLPVVNHVDREEWSEETRLTLIANACRTLAEARTVEEVKEIRDKAEALRMYLRQRDESLEAQNAAAEIKIRAERRAGKLLDYLPRRHLEDGRPRKASNDSTLSPVKLSDLGVNRDQSSQWQKVASLSKEDFERHIAETKESGKELTTAGVLRLAKQVRETTTEPRTLTLYQFIERLDDTIKRLFAEWPVDYRGAMAHHLISMGQEILEHGDLRP